MHLYSKNQVVIVAALCVLAAIMITTPVVFFFVNKASSASSVPAQIENKPPQITEPEAKAQAKPVLYDNNSLKNGYSQDEVENIMVYEKFNSGVVNITTEFINAYFFFDPVPEEGASGSGSIIDAKGYVLTNYHVVSNAYRIYVNLADGSRIEGKIIGSDPDNDLAVIKFDPPAGVILTVIPYGDSTSLKVGQKVLAIGNPFGLERTLTRGIVSGLGRPVQQKDNIIIRDMIQTDASINPGNSGGPLLNSQGELVGVNTMIYSPSGGSVGVGFAVPVSTAKRIVPELIKYGSVKRGWIQAEFVQLFPALVSYMKENRMTVPVSEGLLVSAVRAGSNADRAGIKGGAKAVATGRSTFYVGGDIITSVDGMEIKTISDLYSALEDNKPGENVQVEFYRGLKKMTVNVTLTDRALSLGKSR